MDYPVVPPGVRMFDPRRVRRHNRKQRELSLRLQQQAALKALVQQRKAERKAQLQAEAEAKGFLTKTAEKVKGFTKRLLSRGVR